MRKRKKNFWIWTGLILILSAGLCWAEEKKTKDFEAYTLGEIVVSGDKVRETTVIAEVTAEDIAATNSKTVAEALTYAPGVKVTMGRKNEPNVSIRNFDQSQALVLIDGVPYYETNFGKLDLNQIPTDNVARIEVIKGGASVLYGANALAGVINIITRQASEKPFTSATAEFSENNTYRLSATHGMKKGIWSWWLNASFLDSDGWNLSDDFKPKKGTLVKSPGGRSQVIFEDGGKRDNSDVTSKNFWAKFGAAPMKDSEFFVNFHYLNRDKGSPASTDSNTVFLTRPAFSTAFVRIQNYEDWGLDLDGRHRLNDQWNLKAKLFYHHHNDDYVSFSDASLSKQIAVSRFEDYIMGGSFFADYQPVKWNNLRLSLHFKEDDHKERDDAYLPFAESKSYTGSLGLEDEFTLVKNLSLVGGISYDWFDVNQAQKNVTAAGTGNFVRQISNPTPNTSEFNPMIGLNYQVADMTKLFGSAARKSRFPTLQQLYSTRGGNPNLSSETSINYTLGIDQALAKIGQLELALFYYDVSNLISRDAPGPLGSYLNYGYASRTGLEFGVSVYPLAGLLLRGDYTYIESKNLSSGRVSDDVTFSPQHKLDLGVQYIVPQVKTKLDLIGLYVGEAFSQLPTPQNPNLATLKTGDYFVTNFKVTQPILKWFEVYVAVNNIFDINYEPEFGFPAPGRTFWGGVTGKF
ncbi:MAG: TonB-dependent receptor [Deltaproteobacteria bacterium]|nr:TonB-dependent receptor [Deltaproteobacteria bacterium]